MGCSTIGERIILIKVSGTLLACTVYSRLNASSKNQGLFTPNIFSLYLIISLHKALATLY